MTRENSSFKYIAITLCIMLVLTSWSTFVCVSGEFERNTQFFAVNLYLTFSPMARHTLSPDTGLKVVSWMRKPDFFPDNPTLGPNSSTMVKAFADKLCSATGGKLRDVYTLFKSTSFFLRI